MNLALFDFDETLTKKDTLIEFIRFTHGDFRFLIGLIILSPILISYKLGFYPNWKAKEAVFGFFFEGMEVEVFDAHCVRFFEQQIQLIFRPEILSELRKYCDAGFEVWIVSASPENWVGLFANYLRVNFIGTKLAATNGRLTGKISGKNCYGPEKVERLKKVTDLSKYSLIVAFGNGRGDAEMLELAR